MTEEEHPLWHMLPTIDNTPLTVSINHQTNLCSQFLDETGLQAHLLLPPHEQSGDFLHSLLINGNILLQLPTPQWQNYAQLWVVGDCSQNSTCIPLSTAQTSWWHVVLYTSNICLEIPAESGRLWGRCKNWAVYHWEVGLTLDAGKTTFILSAKIEKCMRGCKKYEQNI